MKVRDLLTDESKWTQHLYARDANGVTTDLSGPYATCWCLVGALERCYGMTPEFSLAYTRLARRTVNGVTEWNDTPTRTFTEVRALVEELDI